MAKYGYSEMRDELLQWWAASFTATAMLGRAGNSQQKKSGLIHAIIYTTSKRIELESPDCSGFKVLWICFKTWATGTF